MAWQDLEEGGGVFGEGDLYGDASGLADRFGIGGPGTLVVDVIGEGGCRDCDSGLAHGVLFSMIEGDGLCRRLQEVFGRVIGRGFAVGGLWGILERPLSEDKANSWCPRC